MKRGEQEGKEKENRKMYKCRRKWEKKLWKRKVKRINEKNGTGKGRKR